MKINISKVYFLPILSALYIFTSNTQAQDSLYLVGTITGESYQKRITNISRVGDVNGDGYNDFMVSSRTGKTRNDQGVVQLYLGSSTLDLTPDVTFHYPCCDTLNNLGNANEIGDVNGDGYDDFTITGVFGDWGFVRGKVFVYYGGETIDTLPDAEFYENTIQDYFGSVVEEVGDLNKDGYDDFVICSSYNWSDGKGHVYLFWGGDTISWNRSLTFASNIINDFFGESVTNIGDANIDGFEDIAIGAPAGLMGSDTGKVYVYYGGNLMDTDLDTILTSENQGYKFGNSVKNIGNLNGDDIVDFCIKGFEAIFIYNNLLNQPRVINGYSLDTGGDINGDGFDDVIIGYDRKINVYFGSENFNINPNIILDDSLRGSTQYIYIIGDLNKDGYDEIISFAPNYPITENPQGKVYIYSYNKLTDVEDIQKSFLNDFELNQNYPNPFNPATNIRFALSSRQFVTLTIYDVLGKKITKLIDEEKPAGQYEVDFNANNLSSGVYFYQLKSGSFILTRKMVLLR
jgi:hypothetical protein